MRQGRGIASVASRPLARWLGAGSLNDYRRFTYRHSTYRLDAIGLMYHRNRWLPGVDLTVRTATAERTMRFTWPDKTTVVVGFASKGPAKSMVAVQHEKLPDQAAATRVKQYWTERLGALEGLLVTAVGW